MNTPLSTLPNELSEENAAELLRSLLHKEGSWVDWGQKCQQLQKAGYNAEQIFEQTGFQKVQQNLIIVAAQVYECLVREQVSEDVLDYYLGPKSDVLYELRILNQQKRAFSAIAAKEKGLDAESAKELARAVQDFTYLSQLPSGFTDHPGDALAYQCWKLAKQNRDLAARTRLIAKGLKFAHSASARSAIEQLLSEITVTPTQKAPLVPLYRQEDEEQVAKLIPVVGSFPLTVAQIEVVKPLEIMEPFGCVNYSGTGGIVAIPGWQIILKAIDPVALFCASQQVSETLTNKTETVLVVIDRGSKDWSENAYFLVAENEQVAIRWFENVPTAKILGQAIVVLRPKRIFDENNLREPWQMDD
ncbi:MAG: RuBisCO accumulation factor 1 [Microcystaceae cyanobacterium]